MSTGEGSGVPADLQHVEREQTGWLLLDGRAAC